MKNISSSLLFVLLATVGFSLPATSASKAPEPAMTNAAQQTVVLDVPGMTCEFCPITIRKALEKVEGVIDAKADFPSKTATVSFDPKRTNVDALLGATASAGYPATVKR